MWSWVFHEVCDVAPVLTRIISVLSWYWYRKFSFHLIVLPFSRCRNPGSIYNGPKTTTNQMKEPTPQPNALCFDYSGCTVSHKVINSAISSILKPVPGAKVDIIQVRAHLLFKWFKIWWINGRWPFMLINGDHKISINPNGTKAWKCNFGDHLWNDLRRWFRRWIQRSSEMISEMNSEIISEIALPSILIMEN